MSVDTESARIFAQLIEAMIAGPGVDEPTARDVARVLRELSTALDQVRAEVERLHGLTALHNEAVRRADAERDKWKSEATILLRDLQNSERTLEGTRAQVERLRAREEELDQLAIVRERDEARAALENYYRPYVDAIRRAYGCGELDPDPDPASIAALRAQVERLQDDVVSLTQAGDLHRKEGDEAIAHLCELVPLAKASSTRERARIDEAKVYLGWVDRERWRVPAPVEPDPVVIPDWHAALTAAGLVRNKDGDWRKAGHGGDYLIVSYTDGWWAMGSETIHPTEEQAARAWLAAREAPRG